MRAVPQLRPMRELTVPDTVERTLPNGLTVLVIQRAAVPLVEMRLRVPLASPTLDDDHVARAAVLAQTLFSGTPTKSTVDIAAELQTVGGAIGASVDADRLMISGNALSSGLDLVLSVLGEVLTGASFPDAQVAIERDRLADRIQMAQSQPAHLARVAMLRRRYGTHPYAVQTPGPSRVRSVTPTTLRGLHAERVHPAGAILVVVGDVAPEQALDAIEQRLSTWDGGGKDVDQPAVPAAPDAPLLLVDRPGAVQSSLRLVLPAVDRKHPDHPALYLANLIFGGYFSSRWVENIREDKGYTYSSHSAVEHSQAGSVLMLSTDVATGVTGPALLETQYELGRMATQPPGVEELEQARQYALGTLQLATSTQSGLANLATMYAAYGMRLEDMVRHAARVAVATREEVGEAAARYLAPAGALALALGDAAKIEGPLATLTRLERTTLDEVIEA